MRWLLPAVLASLAACFIPTAHAQFDYGDAPPTYLTLSVNGGPHHIVSPYLRLGAEADGEADGQPGVLANGDDNAGVDDDDGVELFASTLDRIVGGQIGAWSQLRLAVHHPLLNNAYVNIWVDFNSDGDFADAGERVVTNALAIDGINDFGFFTPLTAPVGFTYARVRLSDLALAGPGGFGGQGEVEDYRIEFTRASGASNVQAYERYGQRWITWQFTPATAAQVYEVYWSPLPLATIATGTLVARLFPDDYCGPRLARQLSDAFGGGAANVNFTIPNATGAGVTTLAADQGLCVQTIRNAIAPGYYAVVPRGTMVVLAANQSALVPLSVPSYALADSPRPHLQQVGLVNGGAHRVAFYTFWADGDDNAAAGRLDFPLMGNSARRGVPHHCMLVLPNPAPTNGPQPLALSLHGGNGAAIHWLPGDTLWNRSGGHLTEGFSIGLEDRVPQILRGRPEAISTRWIGWTATWNPFDNAPALPPDGELIQPYTLTRLNWLLDWWLERSELNLDPARVAVRGVSLGAVGAMLWAHTSPERFSHLTMCVPPLHWGHLWPDRQPLYGTDAQNLRIAGLTNANGNLLRFRDTMSLTESLAPGAHPPPTQIYSGKRDEWWCVDYEADFEPDLMQDILAADLASGAQGVQFYWDQRQHGQEAWTLAEAGNPFNCPNFTTNDFWIPTVATQTRRDDAEAHFRFRNDQSFPAFYQMQLDPAEHGDPGSVEYNGLAFQQITEREGAPYDGVNDPCTPGLPVVTGDRRGTWGGYFDWFTGSGADALRDLPQQWACSVTLVNGVDAGGRTVAAVDNAPTNSLSARVAIRRPQNFTPLAGTPVLWMKADRASGLITQSGSDEVGPQGLVKLAQIDVPRLPNIARLLVATHADFGDAPAGYAVTFAEGGAHHASDSLLRLGTARNTETNGIHSTNALSATEADDGVSNLALWTRGSVVTLRITVNQACRLDAWVDWAQNNRWAGTAADLLDRVADSVPLVAGNNLLQVTVPGTAAAGTTYARFRVSTAGGLSPAGPALDGEVEDYPVTITVPPRLVFGTNNAGHQQVSWLGNSSYSSQLEHSPNLVDWFRLDVPAQEVNGVMSLEIPPNLLDDPQHFFRLARAPLVTSPVPTEPGFHTGLTFVHGGLARNYYLGVPTGWNAATNWPLMLALPGHTQSIAEFASLQLELIARASSNGMILVFPEATDGADSYRWFPYENPNSSQPYLDDAAFLLALVNHLGASGLNVNTNRLYLSGFSNGGSMTHYMASRTNHPFAAFAIMESGTATYCFYPEPYDRLAPESGTNRLSSVPMPWRPRPVMLMNMATSVPWVFEGRGAMRGARHNVARWVQANGLGAPVTNGLGVIEPPVTALKTTTNWTATGNDRARVAYDDIRPDHHWPTNLVAGGWTLANALRFPYFGLVGTNVVEQRLPEWVRLTYPHTLSPDPAAPTTHVRVDAGTMTREVWRSAPLNRTNEVIFIGLSDGGHQWPNATDKLPFNGSDEVLKFFNAH